MKGIGTHVEIFRIEPAPPPAGKVISDVVSKPSRVTLFADAALTRNTRPFARGQPLVSSTGSP
jgi:hypothetical protein